MSHQNLYLDNDNLFTLEGLKDQETDTYVNTATVELTIEDSEGATVPDGGFPLTMDYVADSNGSYQGVVDKALSIENSLDYVGVITVSGVGIKDGEWRLPLRGTFRIE